MKVICIDDTNLPNDLPKSKHVVEGETYTVLGWFTVQRGGKLMSNIW